MPSVVLYFQVHQPYRLKRYTYLNVGSDHEYFDDGQNAEIVRRVARKCYLPANEILLNSIEKSGGKFRLAFSISGTAIQQLERWSPETIESFQALAKTGCVEFLAETSHHTLASLYDPTEFQAQVRLHRTLVEKYFGQKPRVFRNTELIYDDAIGQLVSSLGFEGILAEGVDDILGWRSPHMTYQVPGTRTRILLKNYRLSDDIAFRFSNREWTGWPLTPEKYASWIHTKAGDGDVVGLFLDYETFGEHHWEPTGIFDFLQGLPAAILENHDWNFLTPSQTIDRYLPAADLSFRRLTSWADEARDVSAWRGNRMQNGALQQIYDTRALFGAATSNADPAVVEKWRKLQTSDHFYYMSTKNFGDGAVHRHFSPYESPYDAFIAFMNVTRDFKTLALRSDLSTRTVVGM